MRDDAPPVFKPRKLGRHDLEAPYTPALRRLPAVTRDDLQQRRKALLVNTDRFRGRNARVLRHYTWGGAAFVPLAAGLLWFFWMGRSPWTLLAMPVLGAAYGAGLALLRPGAWVAGIALAALDLVLFAVDGSSPFTGALGFVWCFHLTMLCLGVAVGATSTYD